MVESLQNSITLFDIKNDYQFLIKTKYMLRGTWYSEQKYCLVTVYVFIKKKKCYLDFTRIFSLFGFSELKNHRNFTLLKIQNRMDRTYEFEFLKLLEFDFT